MIHPTSRHIRSATAAFALGLLVASAAHANQTYTVDETLTGPLNGVAGNPSQTDSVIGTITTDGTLGTLHAGNLVSFSLDLVDVTTPANSYLLTSANASVTFDSGNALSATSSGLFYDFGVVGGGFAFQANSPGAGSGQHYWCMSNSFFACASGNSIAPGNVFGGDPGDDLVIAAVGTPGAIGNAPLNASAVPEPAMTTLLALGLVGLAWGRRRQAACSSIARAARDASRAA